MSIPDRESLSIAGIVLLIEVVAPVTVGAVVGAAIAGGGGAVLFAIGLTLLWWFCGWLADDDD